MLPSSVTANSPKTLTHSTAPSSPGALLLYRTENQKSNAKNAVTASCINQHAIPGRRFCFQSFQNAANTPLPSPRCRRSIAAYSALIDAPTVTTGRQPIRKHTFSTIISANAPSTCIGLESGSKNGRFRILFFIAVSPVIRRRKPRVLFEYLTKIIGVADAQRICDLTDRQPRTAQQLLCILDSEIS